MKDVIRGCALALPLLLAAWAPPGPTIISFKVEGVKSKQENDRLREWIKGKEVTGLLDVAVQSGVVKIAVKDGRFFSLAELKQSISDMPSGVVTVDDKTVALSGTVLVRLGGEGADYETALRKVKGIAKIEPVEVEQRRPNPNAPKPKPTEFKLTIAGKGMALAQLTDALTKVDKGLAVADVTWYAPPPGQKGLEAG
jgi:hypothetical protein